MCARVDDNVVGHNIGLDALVFHRLQPLHGLLHLLAALSTRIDYAGIRLDVRFDALVFHRLQPLCCLLHLPALSARVDDTVVGHDIRFNPATAHKQTHTRTMQYKTALSATWHFLRIGERGKRRAHKGLLHSKQCLVWQSYGRGLCPTSHGSVGPRPYVQPSATHATAPAGNVPLVFHSLQPLDSLLDLPTLCARVDDTVVRLVVWFDPLVLHRLEPLNSFFDLATLRTCVDYRCVRPHVGCNAVVLCRLYEYVCITIVNQYGSE